MSSRTPSFASLSDNIDKDFNELLDSDNDDSVVTLPTPKPARVAYARTGELARAHHVGAFDENDGETTLEDNDIDADDLPDLDQLSREMMSRRSSSTQSHTYASEDPATQSDDEAFSQPSPVKRKSSPDFELGSDEDEPDEAPSPPLVKKRRTRKDPEQARLEREVKAAAKKAEAERMKQERALERERKKAEKATQKVQKQQHATLNKLVTSKTDTLKDMTMEPHPDLCTNTSPFHQYIEPFVQLITTNSGLPHRMRERPAWPVNRMDPDVRFRGMTNLIRWKRKISARYNEEEREWQAVESPYYRTEGLYTLYVTPADVLQQLRFPPATRFLYRNLKKLRTTFGPQHRLFVVLDGSSNQAKGISRSDMERIKDWLTDIHCELGCTLVFAKSGEDIVRRLYNITADLGIMPHKIIERSHLPFCPTPNPHMDSFGEDKKTKSARTTYLQMLQQIHHVTPPMAVEISKKVGHRTLREMYETYADPTLLDRQKDNLLMGITKSGKETNRCIGQVVSARVHAVFSSKDPLQLVGKGKD
ncbi:putative monocarboxylate transporter mch1 [Tulasnella sp. 403]|nr:putative monocarboxylate transporter mch1 [Tulasnella sp. 403]